MSEELPENEAQFMAWFEAENHRRELTHLKALRARYEWLIIAAALLTAAWLLGLYTAFQMGQLPGDVAGLTTAVVISGGTFILVRLHQLRGAVMKRLKAERQRELPPQDAGRGAAQSEIK